jgi:hypothetical protein
MIEEIERESTTTRCHFCAEDLNVQKFLSVNGPELAYEFGKRLISAAMEDVNAAMTEHNNG